MPLLKVCIHLILAILSSLLLLALVISIASPKVWFDSAEFDDEPSNLTVLSPNPSTATERAAKLLSRIEELDREDGTPPPSGSVETEVPTIASVLRAIFSRLLTAGYLDTAPFGMQVMYGLLLATFTLGVFTALSRSWRGTEYAAHALPFLGVAGTLMSFMIFAASSKAGAGNLRAFSYPASPTPPLQLYTGYSGALF